MNTNIIIGIVLLILLVLLISITMLLSKKINHTVKFVLYVLCGLLLIGAIISFSIKSSNNGTGGTTGGGSDTYNLYDGSTTSNFAVGKPSYMTSGHSWTIKNISSVATGTPTNTNGVVSSTGLGFLIISGSGTASISSNTIWSKTIGPTPWGIQGYLIDSIGPGQSCTINWNLQPNSSIEFYNLGANYIISIDSNGMFSSISNPTTFIKPVFTITAQ